MYYPPALSQEERIGELEKELAEAYKTTDELLRDALSLLQNIQRSHKGSIGTINNIYLPQLLIDNVDGLATRISAHIEGRF